MIPAPHPLLSHDNKFPLASGVKADKYFYIKYVCIPQSGDTNPTDQLCLSRVRGDASVQAAVSRVRCVAEDGAIPRGANDPRIKPGTMKAREARVASVFVWCVCACGK